MGVVSQIKIWTTLQGFESLKYKITAYTKVYTQKGSRKAVALWEKGEAADKAEPYFLQKNTAS